jgi:hypothetical protein
MRPGKGCKAVHCRFQEAVGFGNRRLQIGRSGLFLTVFLLHGRAMGLQRRQNCPRLGPLWVKSSVFGIDGSKSDSLLG